LVSSTSSKPPFKPGKVDTNGKASLPKPRNALLPIVLVLLALFFVLGVVLSANGGRNLVALFKALDIPLPQLVRAVVPAPPPIDSAPVSKNRWPWLKAISHHPAPLVSVPTPDEMCRSLASEGQEAPSFVRSGAAGWECSMLFTASADPTASSLFLHVRGADDGRFAVVRVKFNLADGRLTTDLSRHAVAFLRAAMTLPPSENLDEDLAAKMAGQTDFYFVAGYHALAFRREIEDANRYNLIGFNRKIVGEERVTTWPKAGTFAAAAATRAPKGPRLPAQSNGNP
jgi:hypothetical protein